MGVYLSHAKQNPLIIYYSYHVNPLDLSAQSKCDEVRATQGVISLYHRNVFAAQLGIRSSKSGDRISPVLVRFCAPGEGKLGKATR